MHSLFYAFSSVWPISKWQQAWCDGEPLQHFVPARGADQVSAAAPLTHCPVTGRAHGWKRCDDHCCVSVLVAGSTVRSVCTKAWRPSCCRRYWRLPSCSSYTRRSLPPPSKSWAWIRKWSAEDPLRERSRPLMHSSSAGFYQSLLMLHQC